MTGRGQETFPRNTLREYLFGAGDEIGGVDGMDT